MQRSRLSFLILALLSVANMAQAGESQYLDWDDWQRMPVFCDGRVMPLDTFARQAVGAICGRPCPTLDGPDGLREYLPAELLFSWLVEPERWEKRPLLVAGDPALRATLGLPAFDQEGHRLQYASLDEVESNPTIGQLWGDIQKRFEREGKQFRLSGVDKKIKELVDAYDKYRQLMFDPRSPDDSTRRFFSRLHPTIKAWRNLAGALQQSERLAQDDVIRQAMVEMGESLQQIAGQAQGGAFSLEKAEKPVAVFRRAAERLADRMVGGDDKILAAMAAELRRQTIEMHGSLYDNGDALRLIPSLNSAALEENRTPGDDAQPWLSVQALLFGSDDLLHDYPQKGLQDVRLAFSDVKKAYLDRTDANRPQRFSTAMKQFADRVRAFGQDIQPLREELPIQHRDQELLDATAYPPPDATDAEMLYNRLDPFFWSWSISLAAVVCLCFSLGHLRQPMFWAGAIVLAIAQAFTLAGFALRMKVTGLVPLTGMFETVVFVALGVATLGLVFSLLPLFQAGLSEAWRLTALRQPRDGNLPAPRPSSRFAHVTLIGLQAILSALVFLAIVRLPGGLKISDSDLLLQFGIFDLLPQSALGAAGPSINDFLVWLAGMSIVLLTVWLAPRCFVTFCIACFAVPRTWFRGVAAPMEDVMRRRFFVLGGAAMACLAVVLACYAPATVMKRNLGAVAPILRDNHWLVVHVVTIMASYASAAIALVLGNIALGYYLFGRYRDGSANGADEACPITMKRPPEACATLAGFTYTAVQITVLLLTAGTILGALWADKSWGRFWGWDPKEVWALVSLLVYLIILHARSVGWAGNFGMAVAAVLGATAVLFTWYGVNFVLNSGMHSYGAGSGGQWQVAAAVGLNWLFLLAASIRYLVESGGKSTSPSSPKGENSSHGDAAE